MRRETDPCELVQPDLISLLNSVPHSRISDSLMFSLHLIQNSRCKAWQSQRFQVSTKPQEPIFRGGLAFMAPMWMADLPDFVQDHVVSAC